ncbi:MAG: hypothetical protein ACREA0_07800, partial [bacterium]
IYFAEPMFQDGIIAQAVDQVKARGVSYFSAAGNDGRKSYESSFRPSGLAFDIGFGFEEAHDFERLGWARRRRDALPEDAGVRYHPASTGHRGFFVGGRSAHPVRCRRQSAARAADPPAARSRGAEWRQHHLFSKH